MARQGRVARLYLLAYNCAQAAGWAYSGWLLAQHVAATGSLRGAYAAAGEPVRLFQLASALEIVHAALGLVGGSPVTALMQWAGRSNVLFGVVAAVPEVQPGLAVGAMLAAWAASEVVRYPWYAAGVAGACPHWLTWLRYTAFIPLYPIGVVVEMAAVYQALPLIRGRRLRSVAMPNPFNFAFDYHTFLVALLALYPLLWFRLYSFLFRQRAKKLGPGAEAGSSAKKQA
ncbi:very-long-chain (3R)-3-hydroxyacyl-dehydratase 2 [Micractinium conductrix]|uniref:Very-long-chain (3R)-3-hydroxyacyl-CoA dehydratase n=1 Tax=Micractinium conductrix TaxID=554055 RepID=A0A2P6VMZ8_9CHLO|nr:very-long-chain (3R)-3-hydroxyacyl-dehydratase 2 [Micractinium conductrix]|eukprot:PSC75468.1 very-long-chain (3R)-3-hydroxyacyl-dehydratase 2 [Micractinium conductrix]